MVVVSSLQQTSTNNATEPHMTTSSMTLYPASNVDADTSFNPIKIRSNRAKHFKMAARLNTGFSMVNRKISANTAPTMMRTSGLRCSKTRLCRSCWIKTVTGGMTPSWDKMLRMPNTWAKCCCNRMVERAVKVVWRTRWS